MAGPIQLRVGWEAHMQLSDQVGDTDGDMLVTPHDAERVSIVT